MVVIEQNRDEQLRKLITIETNCPKDKLLSITYYGGQPLSKGHVLDGLAEWIPELAGSEPGEDTSGGDVEPDPLIADACFMSYIKKPAARHPKMPTNAIGLTPRDYEGSMSTLCAGCGHDSVTAALIQAFFELAVEPHRLVKISGIGCSAKTPTYFVSEAHGFNSVHGPHAFGGRGRERG